MIEKHLSFSMLYSRESGPQRIEKKQMPCNTVWLQGSTLEEGNKENVYVCVALHGQINTALC